MKKIVLVTIEEEARDRYLENLEYFFKEYVEIEAFSIKKDRIENINADLVIISHPSVTKFVKEYIPMRSEVIYLDLTFRIDSIDKINKIDPGKKVIIADYNRFLALDTIAILFELGIRHIEFFPFSEDEYSKLQDVDEYYYDTAITPGLRSYVPEFVDTVIDIGWRMINISTITNIATKLNIEEYDLNDKIIKYSETIAQRSWGTISKINELVKSKSLFNIITDATDDGYIVLDNINRITNLNRLTTNLFNKTEKELIGKNISEVLNVSQYKMEKECFSDYITKIPDNGKDVVISKRRIKIANRSFGYLIKIQVSEKIHEIDNKLRKELTKKGYIAKYRFEDIMYKSSKMKEVINRSKKIAKIDVTTLITGETGTGKEIIANAIHNESKRRKNQFIAVNCAALPDNLLESELFGYEEGAFTGAKKGGKKGLFELADRGTIFLDEIGDISLNVQVKLLRVLQEKVIMRIGGSKIIPIDVRVLTATNKNLEELIDIEKFRKDLYYRLNVFSIKLPKLSERKEDILEIIREKFEEEKIDLKIMDKEVLDFLLDYEWKGNVRELINCLDYIIKMNEGYVEFKDLPPYLREKKENAITSNLFEELTKSEKQVANQILHILKKRNVGRRKITSILNDNGYNISEYKVRKLLKYLKNKDII